MAIKKFSISIDSETFDKLQNLKNVKHVNISAFIASAIKEKLSKEDDLK
jgi:predicted transcriptional regulator